MLAHAGERNQSLFVLSKICDYPVPHNTYSLFNCNSRRRSIKHPCSTTPKFQPVWKQEYVLLHCLLGTPQHHLSYRNPWLESIQPASICPKCEQTKQELSARLFFFSCHAQLFSYFLQQQVPVSALLLLSAPLIGAAGLLWSVPTLALYLEL